MEDTGRNHVGPPLLRRLTEDGVGFIFNAANPCSHCGVPSAYCLPL